MYNYKVFRRKKKDFTTKEVYDQNGLILEEYSFRDIEQKEIDFKLVFEYANGTLVKFIYLEPDKTGLNLLPECEILYEYDEYGNLSHGVEQSFDGSAVKNRSDAYCTHDLYGNVTHMTDIEHSGSADEKRTEYSYTYTFDSHGNWLTKTEHGETDKVTRRRITYWK